MCKVWSNVYLLLRNAFRKTANISIKNSKLWKIVQNKQKKNIFSIKYQNYKKLSQYLYDLEFWKPDLTKIRSFFLYFLPHFFAEGTQKWFVMQLKTQKFHTTLSNKWIFSDNFLLIVKRKFLPNICFQWAGVFGFLWKKVSSFGWATQYSKQTFNFCFIR